MKINFLFVFFFYSNLEANSICSVVITAVNIDIFGINHKCSKKKKISKSLHIYCEAGVIEPLTLNVTSRNKNTYPHHYICNK